MSLAKKIAFTLAKIPVAGPKIIETAMRRRWGASVVTPEKVRNYLLAQRESAAGAVEVESLPYTLNMDTANVCNLACPFCPTGTRQLKREKSRLSIPDAQRVIDAVKAYTITAAFYNWGEPFLNPDIFATVNYAVNAGIYTNISSNLSVRVKDIAEKVLDSGLDCLRVSLDGIEQATLEQYRRGADIKLVLDNVRKIVEAKRKKRSAKPRIDLVFLVFRHNEHEIGRLPALRRELGVDSFVPTSSFVYHNTFVPEHPDFPPIHEIFPGTCHYLYSELMIEADGHISPCCTNMNTRFDIGTIDDLRDMRRFWNSPILQAMRAFNAGIAVDDPADLLCRYCQFAGGRSKDAGPLSPLSPSMAADGETIHHGLDGPEP